MDKRCNLFFVHTPFQLFVAQQIIFQNKLTNNIMIYGYIGNNHHTLEIYDLMIISDFWDDRIYMKDINNWGDLRLRTPISNIKRINKSVIFINNILKKYNVEKIYLGDIDNITYQFLIKLFGNEYDVIIYEEGSSHYFHSGRLHSNVLKHICYSIIDFLFYYPKYKFSFKNFILRNEKIEELPIFIRYSINPNYHHEKYDRILTTQKICSSELHSYLESDIEPLRSVKNKILVLTQPMYGEIDENISKRYMVYLKVLDSYFKSLPPNVTIVLKFHPREFGKKQTDIINLLQCEKRNYYVLAKTINIPVEYYLQEISFDEITTFYSSTVLYNGYIYPQTKICSLLNSYCEECTNLNLDISYIHFAK